MKNQPKKVWREKWGMREIKGTTSLEHENCVYGKGQTRKVWLVAIWFCGFIPALFIGAWIEDEVSLTAYLIKETPPLIKEIITDDIPNEIRKRQEEQIVDELEQQREELTVEIPLEEIPLTIPEQIQEIADEMEYEDSPFLLDLSFCESSHNPLAVGDNGDARGLYQFSRRWHPDISDECAFSVSCSTRKTIELLRQNKSYLWTCTDIVEDWL